MNNKEITTEQLAKMMGVTTMTVYRWRKSGMPFIQRNRNISFDQREVMEWCREQGFRFKMTR